MGNGQDSNTDHFLTKPAVMAVVLCAITFCTYAGTLAFGFVYDDNVTIVRNVNIRSFDTVFRALTSTGSFSLYRPVTVLWVCSDYALFGLNPAWWHFTSLALHVLVTCLVFFVTYELAGDRKTAFVAGLLFGVHPAHVENVAWVSAINDLLMSALLLGSFLAFLKFRVQKSKGWLGLSSLLFALALLAKETAVVWPVLILAFSWIFNDERGKYWKRRAVSSVRMSAPFWFLMFLYIIARSLAVRAAVTGKAATVGWGTMLLTWPSILWFDVRHLVLPTALSEFYLSAYTVHLEFQSFGLPLVLMITIALGLFLWSRASRNAQIVRFACLCMFVPLVPTLYLRALTANDFLHDRFLYLPSVGFVILVAAAIHELPTRSCVPYSSKLPAVLAALLVTAGVVGTVSNQLPWGSDILLYQNGLKFTPDSSNLKDNLANSLADRGQSDRAITLYHEVLQRDPRFWRSNYNLGHEYLKRGDNQAAEEYLSQAVEIDGTDPDQFIFLAIAQWREGKLADAIKNARHAIEISPGSSGYHYVLGSILDASGDRGQAISEFKLEIAKHPENVTASDRLRRLQSLQ